MAWMDRRYDDDGPTFGREQRPVGTFWIIGVTVFVQILSWSIKPAVEPGSGSWGSISAESIRSFELWRPVTYIFLHGSVGHLFWNMLILFFLGSMLELHLGTVTFVRIYLIYGVLSGLSVLVDPTIPAAVSTVGASGAVMGLVAFLGSRFPRLPVRLFLLITIQAWVLAVVLVGMDLLSLVAYRGGDGTAHGVHLAGAACGFFHGFLWQRYLADWWEGRREYLGQKQRQQERRRDAEEQVEMDRILKKLKDEGGMHKLSEEEREFLLAQSQKLKDRSR